MSITTSSSGTSAFQTTRSTSRRLVLELAAVAVLAGLGAQFPRDVDAGTAWSFLAGHWSALAHAALGGVVLVEATVFLRRLGRTGPRSLRVLGGAGLACVAVSVVSGLAYVARHQPDGALVWMTLGWLGGLLAYSVAWFCTRHRRLPQGSDHDASAAAPPH